MTLKIYRDLEQRSEAWYEARRGIVTASAVGKLISVGKLSAIDYRCPKCSAEVGAECYNAKGDGVIKTFHSERTAHSAAEKKNSPTILETASNDESRGLTAALVAERIYGFTDPTFVSIDMNRGVFDEPFARDAYARHMGVEVQEVGFITEDKWGFKIGLSPDGLVGDDGGVEIKSRRTKGQVLTGVAGMVPFDHIAQIQCSLLVTGRQWWDYVSFAGGTHLFIRRVYPDANWQTAIVNAVRTFEVNAAEMAATYMENVAAMPMTERPIYDLEVI